MIRFTRLLLSGCLFLFLVFVALPSTVQAQGGPDCAGECVTCLAGKKEGRNHSAGSKYDMTCDWVKEGETCPTEGCLNATVEDHVPSELIAELVSLASPAELPAVIAAYGDRLAVASEREFVVVLGQPCDPLWLSYTVQLSATKVDDFERLGTRNLETLLALKASVATQVP